MEKIELDMGIRLENGEAVEMEIEEHPVSPEVASVMMEVVGEKLKEDGWLLPTLVLYFVMFTDNFEAEVHVGERVIPLSESMIDYLFDEVGYLSEVVAKYEPEPDYDGPAYW